MKISESPYYDKILESKNYAFGNYYFFEDFVIGETNEGVISSLEHVIELFEDINRIYKDKKKIVYIFNRINSYSLKLVDWARFLKTPYFKKVKGYAVVSYSEATSKNFLLESMFSKLNMRKTNSLKAAIEWACELK